MDKPTSIIILGITGDLAQKKILPALFDLHVRKQLPEKIRIIGFSRKPFSETEIHEFVKKTLPQSESTQETEEFLNIITYVQGNFDEADSYKKLGDHLSELDLTYHDGCSNKLFYLSVPPTLYESIATHLSASGLSIPCGGPDGYARILVEKPFGKDLKTAEQLDELFGKLFKDEQIFRIDHYLAKDSLFKIIDLHRKDLNLATRWNKENIERVEINLFETAVVGSRGVFYDGVGALRDVGQNHMLQMLALVAMDIPREHTPQAIQQSRTKILEHLVPLSAQEISKMKRGQYDGYLSEPGVAANSTTETFFSVTVGVNSETFVGVPFILTSGKALNKNLTEIIVIFADGSRVVFTVPPEDSLPAYQKIILDCIAGDQTVFTSTEEVLAEWKFITPISMATADVQPFTYIKGVDPMELTK
jgi:glucose-6-phosphate 1-dehydrogenase